jgi:hypothetical protein
MRMSGLLHINRARIVGKYDIIIGYTVCSSYRIIMRLNNP